MKNTVKISVGVILIGFAIFLSAVMGNIYFIISLMTLFIFLGLVLKIKSIERKVLNKTLNSPQIAIDARKELKEVSKEAIKEMKKDIEKVEDATGKEILSMFHSLKADMDKIKKVVLPYSEMALERGKKVLKEEIEGTAIEKKKLLKKKYLRK